MLAEESPLPDDLETGPATSPETTIKSFSWGSDDCLDEKIKCLATNRQYKEENIEYFHGDDFKVWVAKGQTNGMRVIEVAVSEIKEIKAAIENGLGGKDNDVDQAAEVIIVLSCSAFVLKKVKQAFPMATVIKMLTDPKILNPHATIPRTLSKKDAFNLRATFKGAKLPGILMTDPTSIWYGLKLGSIVEVKYGDQLMYRQVIRGRTRGS